MYRIIKNIISLLAALFLVTWTSSCNDETFNMGKPSGLEGMTLNADGTVGMDVNIEIPDMMSAASRAMSGTPNFSELNLYVFVFEEDGELKQYFKFDPIAASSDGEHGHNALVKYHVDLEPTEARAVIHLVATDQPNFDNQISFGPEERVINSLATDENHEAYWQRVELDTNIPSADNINPESADYNAADVAKANKIYKKMTHVPAVRNFCRVSLKVSEKVADEDKFIVTGLYVVNTTNMGTVAPYRSDNNLNDYIEYYGEPLADGQPYRAFSYGEISAQGHIGTLPAGVKVINNELKEESIQTKSESSAGVIQPVYFYERPGRSTSTQRTYTILKGRFHDRKDIVCDKDFYYKIDIGVLREGDLVGRFDYYNLLRNFDYMITLHAVECQGYETMEEAGRGVVFNNFSASVEAQNMNSISDGDDMIFVEHTSYVFTYPGQVIDVLAQFREEITKTVGGTERNDLLKYVLEEGEVATSIEEIINHDDTGKNFDLWNNYRVTGGEPTDALKQQMLYIYRGNKAADGEPVHYGLYRAITLFSHTPWPILHIDILPNLYTSVNQVKDFEWSDETRTIESVKRAPLTLFFELPAGLPQAIFPLEFTIEADRQNIQNAYLGNCVVQSVSPSQSLYAVDPTLGDEAPSTTRMQYIKTVTWEEYNTENTEELVGSGSHIVVCPFLTITDLDQVGVGDAENNESITTLRISNPYFGEYDDKTGEWRMYYQDQIYRHSDESGRPPEVEDPTYQSRVWDFNTTPWVNYLQNELGLLGSMGVGVGSTRTRRLTYANNMYDELSFQDGGTSTIRPGTICIGRSSTGYMYVLLSNDNDAISTVRKRVGEHETLKVMIGLQGQVSVSYAPRVVLTTINGSGTARATFKETEPGTPFTFYNYDIEIPETVQTFRVEILRSKTLPSISSGTWYPTQQLDCDFYRIEYWTQEE